MQIRRQFRFFRLTAFGWSYDVHPSRDAMVLAQSLGWGNWEMFPEFDY